jgi:hypothetical protein
MGALEMELGTRCREGTWSCDVIVAGVRDDFRNWLTWTCGPRNPMKISASE